MRLSFWWHPGLSFNYVSESALVASNRKCSTPESDECPSPDFTAIPVTYQPYGNQENTRPLVMNRQHVLDSNFVNFRIPMSYTVSHTNSVSDDADSLEESYPEPPNHFSAKQTQSNLVNVDIPANKRHRFLINEDKSLDSLGESYQNSPSPMKMKKKKTRTVFSRNQIYQLENAFEMKRYLSSAERSGLAAQLKLSETQIKIWFQNRRNKWKRQISGEMDEIPIPPYALHSPAGLLPTPYCSPVSPVSPYGHMLEPRNALLRSSVVPAAPAFYSNPYVQETRLRPSFISW